MAYYRRIDEHRIHWKELLLEYGIVNCSETIKADKVIEI
jgi:hypothetical protein